MADSLIGYGVPVAAASGGSRGGFAEITRSSALFALSRDWDYTELTIPTSVGDNDFIAIAFYETNINLPIETKGGVHKGWAFLKFSDIPAITGLRDQQRVSRSAQGVRIDQWSQSNDNLEIWIALDEDRKMYLAGSQGAVADVDRFFLIIYSTG